MADSFAPLVIPRAAPSPLLLRTSVPRWRSVTVVGRHTLETAVTHVSFSPVEPYDVAASSGFSVTLVGSRGGNVRRSIARFRDTAYSPHFKPDGRLLAAGDGRGAAQVFDLGSRAVLREFKGHKGAVRTVKFSADGLRVMTGSDDAIVKAWDLGTSKCLVSLKGAEDYVRSQNSSPASQHVWITGSLDRKARLYDLRSSKCLFTLDHGSQVDDVHILPGGARAITIGGPEARVWDFFAGGKMITSFTCHAKAVTSGAVDSDGHTFATAGLDGFVKVHDLSSFRTRGILSFGSEILSLGISADGVKYAVGMADGQVEVRSVKKSSKHISAVPQSTSRKEWEYKGWGRGFERVEEESTGPRPGTKRYFNRGPKVKPVEDQDYIVEGYRKPKLQDYDRSLRKFKHGEALDLAVKTNRPAVVISVVEELIMRGALKGALAGRSQEELCPLLGVIQRNIRKPRYSTRLSQLLNVIIDMYAEDFSENEEVDKKLVSILSAVKREVRACHELGALQGAAEAILNASDAAS